MSIKENLDSIRERIERARENSPGQDVTLVAVSKTHPAESVMEAYACGVRIFGENRVQEAVPKIDACGPQLCWRLIGHLQSNKVNKIAGKVSAIDSIDSLSTAVKLNRRLKELGEKLEILIEVNTSGDLSKKGIAPSDLPAFSERIAELKQLSPAGLMTIGPLGGGEYNNRKAFSLLRKLRNSIRRTHPQYTELSMGMSDDFEEAIQEGATMVRIGSLIFGSGI